MGFNLSVDFVQNGEPVSAGVTNRPTRTLEENVLYLYDLIQAAELGEALFARGMTIESDALVGMPVYFNQASNQFERALAAVTVDAVTGGLVMADSSQVWGIVYSKENATKADILINGSASLALTNSAGEAEPEAGTYYLSGTTPGILVLQQPPVSVPVLRTDGQGRVFFVPALRDTLDAHSHFRFELAALPAGTHHPPAPNHQHTIQGPNASLPGWLPASHAIFNGKAPANAVFGYNMSVDEALSNAWPPLPLSGAYLEMDKGEHSQQGFAGVPLGPTGLAIIDRNGIWWLSDCYGDVPWPKNYTNHATDSVSLSDTQVECPRELHMRLQLWFSRPRFATENTAVTSLQSADERLVVRCLNDETPGAHTGPLELDLALELMAQDTGELGYKALKSFDGETFKIGSVVEGIKALSGTVTLTGSTSRLEDPNDAESATVYQGVVGISVSPLEAAELDVQLVRLDQVTEEYLSEVPFLGMSAGRASAYRGKIYIPDSISYSNPKLKLRFVLLGRAAGTLPSLTLTARRLTRPANGLTTPVSLPLSDTALAITTATVVTANTYVEATSAELTVAAGDTVLFTLSRSASDGYSGQVGILRHSGILSSGS